LRNAAQLYARGGQSDHTPAQVIRAGDPTSACARTSCKPAENGYVSTLDRLDYGLQAAERSLVGLDA
jgi:hypothetical protein